MMFCTWIYTSFHFTSSCCSGYVCGYLPVFSFLKFRVCISLYFYVASYCCSACVFIYLSALHFLGVLCVRLFMFLFCRIVVFCLFVLNMWLCCNFLISVCNHRFGYLWISDASCVCLSMCLRCNFLVFCACICYLYILQFVDVLCVSLLICPWCNFLMFR